MSFLLKYLLLFSIINVTAQTEPIYLLLDKWIVIDEFNDSFEPYYECRLTVRSNISTDFYSFIINGDKTKKFEEIAIQQDLIPEKILDNEKLKKMNSCDLHQLLNDKRPIFVSYDPKTKKYNCWWPTYLSTSKKEMIRQRSKI